MDFPNIHIGREIEARINSMGLSLSDFGRRIGVAKQNVRGILDRKNIDVDKLIKISQALDFNFFTLYASEPQSPQQAADRGGQNVSGNTGRVTLNYNESTQCCTDPQEPQLMRLLIDEKNKRISDLEKRIQDKEKIISIYENR